MLCERTNASAFLFSLVFVSVHYTNVSRMIKWLTTSKTVIFMARHCTTVIMDITVQHNSDIFILVFQDFLP